LNDECSEHLRSSRRTVSRRSACFSTDICPLQAGLLQFSSGWCSWHSL